MTVQIVCPRILLATVGVLLSCSAALAADGAGKVRTVNLPDGGQAIAAKTDAHGAIHVLYHVGGSPQYASSRDDGKSFSKPIAVVDQASRKPGLEFHAWDLAIGQGDRVHVALGTNAWKLKLPKEEWGYFYARLEPGEKAFSPLLNINRKPSEGFSLAADAKGNVTACWMAGKLYANVSRDNGQSWATSVEINPEFNPCDCCTTSAAYGADGRLAVLYREETGNERDMYLVLWDQARNQTTRTRVSTTSWKIDSCPMSYYAIVPNASGYTAVWPTKNQIYYGRLDAKGVLLSPAEIKVPGQSGMRTGMLSLPGADGHTLVAWKNENQLGWQLYDERGQAEGRPGSMKSPGKGAAGVVAKDGSFILFQ